MSFTLAIVGRPNVGKSTLFNRLVGKKLALVDDTPGVTRDRREGDARLGDIHFKIIDTAGFEDASGDVLPARMRRQTEAAIAAADVCLFLVDARAGIMPLDEEIARILRKDETPVILAANKCEGKQGEAGRMEAFRLGLGEPLGISAEHGEGTADLYGALLPFAEEAGAFEEDEPEAEPAIDMDAEDADDIVDEEIDDEKPLRLAVVGRPNAGKSTLINALIGEDRMLTGPEAGITRDSISVDWKVGKRRIKLWDTAGLRRRAALHQGHHRLERQGPWRHRAAAQRGGRGGDRFHRGRDRHLRGAAHQRRRLHPAKPRRGPLARQVDGPDDRRLVAGARQRPGDLRAGQLECIECGAHG